MLIYSKVIDGERTLFGTTDKIPAVDDVAITYCDATGQEIEPVAGDTYLDDKMGGIIRKSDGKAVNVFIGETQVIGLTPVPVEDIDAE